jgi:NADPH-dependent 2,4-dienoyl-CoA reductase/sulfur reductase-like enzyme
MLTHGATAMKTYDIVIIGGGPAGLAAALQAAKHNISVLILERSTELGGILPQCIHQGFGLFIFNKNLTGAEYAQHYINQVKQQKIAVQTDTMVLEITTDKKIIATNKHEGLFTLQAKAIILAMGCRERTRCQIRLPGTRPAGIYTAGTTQRLINIEGIMPGKHVVILGSGDVGLIMARRFTLEGAHVQGVYELLPQPSGLTRNIVQCLEDYNIPLHLNHTITDIHGNERIEAVTIAQVHKETMQPLQETAQTIPCDTLILAVGLIPENELTKTLGLSMDPHTGGPIVDEFMHTTEDGIFACGNVVHVHDIVDDVTHAAETAGKSAAQYIQQGISHTKTILIQPGNNVSYIIPHHLRGDKQEIPIYLRVNKVIHNPHIQITADNDLIAEKKVRIVKPPEMVTLILDKNNLPSDNVHILEISVRHIS